MKAFRYTVLLVSSLSVACIERPGDERPASEDVDRGTLSDVLFTEVPPGLTPVEANFDDLVELVGVEYSPQKPKPGDRVTVTAWFKATDVLRDDWKLFVHVDLDGGKAPKLNVDHFPAGGRFKTSAWKPNDVVKDAFTFTAPSGGTRMGIWMGFYLAEERLNLLSPGRASTDGANRVKVATIEMN